jgi:hypothetical protein
MRMKLISYQDYVAGWLDTSIHEFLEVLSPNEPGTKYALITCLDSNPKPASLREKSPELKPLISKLQTLGSGLMLPTASLQASDARNRVFFGFDEVWFFPNESIQPPPRSATLVGPARLNRTRFQRLAKWMSHHSCPLALGDGEGLNFVVQARGPVMFLLGHSIEQPSPALAP